LKFWAFLSGGAALNPRTEYFWRRLGFAVIQGYGMTETAAIVSVNHPFKIGRGSIGKLMPGQELKLDDTGEILVRGPNISPGYWGDSLRPVASEQGWLRTGDVAEMDESGNLYFKGRKKDVIVTAAGMNIHPDDLESALKAQPEVTDCAVVAVETPQGPEPLAALLLKDESANAGEIVGRANKLLSQYQHIRRWVVWPEEDFPRTTTQKIRKQDVLERMKVDFKIEISDLKLSSILREIERVTGESSQGVSAATNLATDLRLDSLGRLELLGALEDRYQIDIDETALTDATTVADLRRLVHKAARRGALEYPYPYWARKWPVTWIRFAVYYLLMLPAIWIMGRPRISGREHLRGLSGPVLLVSNHIVMVDQSLIQAALPARFRHRMAIAMDGEKLRGWRHPEVGTPFFRRLPGLIEYALVASLFNVFSLPLKSGFRRSFRYAGEAMDKGYSVLVFPEGERTKDGNIGRVREGTGLLAAELGAPVVPLKIEGLFEMKAQGRYFARPGELRVKVGEPVRYATSEDPAFITRDLERRVSQL
jgi:long-chain acyl-CoA synthetase